MTLTTSSVAVRARLSAPGSARRAFTTALLGLTSGVGFFAIWLALVPDAPPQRTLSGCTSPTASCPGRAAPAQPPRQVSLRHAGAGRPAAPAH